MKIVQGMKKITLHSLIILYGSVVCESIIYCLRGETRTCILKTCSLFLIRAACWQPQNDNLWSCNKTQLKLRWMKSNHNNFQLYVCFSFLLYIFYSHCSHFRGIQPRASFNIMHAPNPIAIPSLTIFIYFLFAAFIVSWDDSDQF